ncbi:MAG: pilus assembly protein PilM [Anaerohalosphaeraceae bacterium]|nr:pilus assembly protein PilM [Anaerohalosphaeraceae bacterium]
MITLPKIKNMDFVRTRTSPIGLDISFDCVRMIQLQKSADKTAVIAADEILLPSDVLDDAKVRRESIVSAIKDMMVRGRFVSNRVISCVSNMDMVIKSLRVKTEDENEISKILKSNEVERCGLKPDVHEIRYFSAGAIRHGDGVKNEIILMAVDKAALDEHVSMLEDAGVESIGIDAVPCALFRSLHRSMRRSADQDKANVFVDVGGNHTTVIIGAGGEIVFAKQIDIASEHINREIASKLGIGVEDAMHLRNKLKNNSDTEDIAPAMKHIVIDSMGSVMDELAKEISLCFRYYSVTFRGQRPEQLVFAGSEAYEQTLIEALKKHLGIDVEVPEPLRGFDLSSADFPSDKRGPLCEWAVAVGLSMKGMDFQSKGGSCERN